MREPMKAIVIGATGTIGSAVADALAARGHEVVRASRAGDPAVDIADTASVDALLAAVGPIDAVVCCAASAPLTPLTALSDDDYARTLHGKLLGQVNLVRHAVGQLRDGGSIALTSGAIPESTPGSAGGALVNAGLEAFVRAAPIDLPRGIRLNAVSPGWVRETLDALGMDPDGGTPARDVARSYVEAVEGLTQGQVLIPRTS